MVLLLGLLILAVHCATHGGDDNSIHKLLTHVQLFGPIHSASNKGGSLVSSVFLSHTHTSRNTYFLLTLCGYQIQRQRVPLAVTQQHVQFPVECHSKVLVHRADCTL